MRRLLACAGLLFFVLLCGTLAMVATSKQIARTNEPLAPVWVDQSIGSKRLPFGANQVWSMPIGLPDPPFTIEAVARFSTVSAESADWGMLLNDYVAQPSDVLVTNDRHFFVPGSDLPTYFYRLHAAGQFNQIMLTVSVNHQAILALNGQIVWNAPLIFDTTRGEWLLFATNNSQRAMVIHWLQVALYRPAP